MPTRRYRVFLALLLIFAQSAAGQPVGAPGVDSVVDRPRIGLVLGGGGARGATHIGVIRELERLRVPIDAIAGTSMGALVGGLYASGMTASELEEVAASIDWAAMLADQPRRDDLNFRRKQDDQQFPIPFEFGLADGEMRMPMGFVQGHRLELLLHDLTSHVSGIADFDELPIPFRAVASDIENAEAYVLAHGSLAHALRASMSVPGIFAPARIDGRLLADGGLFANLPVDAVREMDVDVIIAVSAEFPLYAPEELDSAIRISEQMLTILIRKETQRAMRTLTGDDILIEPDLGTFGSAEFGTLLEVIEPGAQATLVFSERLSELALDAKAYAAYAARRKIQRDAPRETLAFVRVEHDGTLADEVLEARIHVRPGDEADRKRLAADADRIYGLGLYEQVNYHIVEEGGRRGVVYEAITKSWGKSDLRLGVSLADDFAGSTAFDLTARLTRVGLNTRGAEWRTDLQIGSEPGFYNEFYQPLAAGSHWFVAPRLDLSRFNLNLYENDQRTGRQRISEAEAGLDAGFRIGYTGEFRVGAYRGVGEADVKIGDPALQSTDFDTGGYFASITRDTLDHAHFPTRGVRGELRWTGSRPGLGADSRYDTYQLDFEANWTHGRSTFQVGTGYATTDGEVTLVQDLFRLGGFRRLSGLERGQLSGPHAALARVLYRRRLGDSAGGLFAMPAYIGASLEAGNVWEERADIGFDSALLNGSVFLGLDTYIGPVFLAAGLGEGGDSAYYLFVGAPPR